MKEWGQEYQRKERKRRTKELQDKEELDSMEMVSKILRGPAEDVSVFAKHNHSFAFPKSANPFSLFFSKYFIEPFSFLTQLVEHLPGVEITCTPSQLSVRLQGNNDTHAFQWTFNLAFKVSKRSFLLSTSELGINFFIRCYYSFVLLELPSVEYFPKIFDQWATKGG